jgi:hypothetical protein
MCHAVCAEQSCLLVAWQERAQCQRPLCFTHTHVLPYDAAQGDQSEVIEFQFACFMCRPDTADVDAWGSWPHGAKTGGAG